jgi:antitoxin VapB
MDLKLHDEEAARIIGTLAARTGLTPEEAVKRAASNELARLEGRRAEADKQRVRELIRSLQDEIAAMPPTGLRADKAFFDSLNESGI